MASVRVPVGPPGGERSADATSDTVAATPERTATWAAIFATLPRLIRMALFPRITSPSGIGLRGRVVSKAALFLEFQGLVDVDLGGHPVDHDVGVLDLVTRLALAGVVAVPLQLHEAAVGGLHDVPR